MTEATQDRRKYLRFPTDTLVWWNNDWEPEPITLVDLSAGGMLCEYPRALPTGEKVSLHFEFPGFDRLIYCHCEIAHCRPGEHTYYLIGLRIDSVEGMEMDAFITRLRNGLPPSSEALPET
ncbi:MAG: PilZ domain-containing protein [Acidobacteriota bacterium]|nr:PilZ domain-containing protein [Acidobacteriota bacterium]